MSNDDFTLYRHWLGCGLEAQKRQESCAVQDSFQDTIKQSSAYHEDALVNGEKQPIVATRTDTKKCQVTVVPGDDLHIGDLVHVFKEDWLCVELYVDEFGMKYGELWMCNQVFRYQDHDLNIIEKPAILDDGSYSNGNDKAIKVTDNSFVCYVSLDDESKSLYVDKRLAICTIYDAQGKEILEVGKIKWIDPKSRNFGEGSHLMLFGINDDAFSPEHDSIAEMICDYQGVGDDDTLDETEDNTETEDLVDDQPVTKGYLEIEGRKTMRVGSGRTYAVMAVSTKTGETIDAPDDIVWSVSCSLPGVTIQPNGIKCEVRIAENYDLIGSSFMLSCEAASGEYSGAQMEIGVM